MLNLYELEQFVAFAKYGSLAKVSEVLHISSPTLSRSMQNIENELNVVLFNRTKNSLTLNSTGKLAAKEAEVFLQSSKDMIHRIQDYDESLNSITIRSCAPYPLWTLLNQIGTLYPNLSVRSSINIFKNNTLDTEHTDIYIFPYKIEENPAYTIIPYIKEQLYITVPENHELSDKTSVSFSDIDGYNFLVRNEIGFWETLCRKQMPNSKFFVQADEYSISELVSNSSIPGFITNYKMNNPHLLAGRKAIPISNPQAKVQFYLAVKNTKKLNHLISSITSQK